MESPEEKKSQLKSAGFWIKENKDEFKVMEKNGIIKFIISSPFACKIKKLDFNKKLTIQAAFNLGYTMNDCLLRSQKLFNSGNVDLDKKRYDLHKSKVKQAILEIIKEIQKISKKDQKASSRITEFNTLEELKSTTALEGFRKFKMTNLNELFPEVKSQLKIGNVTLKALENKGILNEFESRQKLRDTLIENDMKKRREIKTRQDATTSSLNQRKEETEIKRDHVKTRNQEIVKNKRKLSISKFELIMKSQSDSPQLSLYEIINKRHSEHQSTILDLDKRKRAIDIKNIQLIREFKEIVQKIQELEQTIMERQLRRQIILEEKSNVARKIIKNVPEKCILAKEKANNRETEKGLGYFKSIKNIERAHTERQKMMKQSSENIKEKLLERKESVKLKLEKLQNEREKIFQRLMQKNNSTDELRSLNLNLNTDLKGRNSFSSKFIFQVSSEAQQANYARIKKIKTVKRIRVLHKFTKLQNQIDEAKAIRMIKDAELQRKEFNLRKEKNRGIQITAKNILRSQSNVNKDKRKCIKNGFQKEIEQTEQTEQIEPKELKERKEEKKTF